MSAHREPAVVLSSSKSIGVEELELEGVMGLQSEAPRRLGVDRKTLYRRGRERDEG